MANSSSVKKSIKGLLQIENMVAVWIDRLAVILENGIHPKHRLTNYHQFFLGRISSADRVLDVGCGQGMVAFALANKAAYVTAVDIDPINIQIAKERYRRGNLSFFCEDATRHSFQEKFDVAVLSNVLEHINHRVAFLKAIRAFAPKILLRVPAINRDWKVLYRKELGLDWRSDKTHFTEYTQEELMAELEEAGYKADEIQSIFGELWVSAKSLV